MPPTPREYDSILRELEARASRGQLPFDDREALQRLAVEVLWQAFGVHSRSTHAISWIGFYDKVPDADEMVLVCREPKPACSPIGLHGMCGEGWKQRRSIVIPNVKALGENYIACDPKDQSELVVPVIDERGECMGVLDADSYDVGAFDEADAVGMTKVLLAMGLTTPEALLAGVCTR
jgi:putative methionine-R-sulfoxide reductase with GAF domain